MAGTPVLDLKAFEEWGRGKAVTVLNDAIQVAVGHVCGPGVLFAKPEGADLVCGYLDGSRRTIPNGYVVLVEAVKAYVNGLTKGLEEHLARMMEQAGAAYEERVEERLRETAKA